MSNRPYNTYDKNGYSNFSQWYIMLYYPIYIKSYRSVIGLITGIKKGLYIILIEDFFKQINIRKDYKKQILNYNIEKFNLRIKDNIDMFLFIKILT